MDKQSSSMKGQEQIEKSGEKPARAGLHKAATKLGISWDCPAKFCPSAQFEQRVKLRIEKEIPQPIRFAWQNGNTPKIEVDAAGNAPQNEVRAYLEARIVEINQARPAGSQQFSLTGGSGATPSSVRYVWTGGTRVAMHTYPLNLGPDPWRVDGVSNVDPPAHLGIELSWSWTP